MTIHFNLVSQGEKLGFKGDLIIYRTNMNHSLAITRNDLSDMQNEGRMRFNVKNVYRCTENILENKSIGFFNEKFTHFSNYSIVERNSMFTQDVRITESANMPLFSLSFIFKGFGRYMYSKNDLMIRPVTNNIWSFGAGQERSILLKKNENSTVLNILFHEHYIEELANKYPQYLQAFYKKYKNNESCQINTQCHLTSPEMNQVISQIKNADLMGNASDLYTEAKILELLALQISGTDKKQNIELTPHCKTIADIEKIKEAKRVLIANLNQPPSILALSRHVGVNENKLKYGFKEIYKQTVYGYLFDYKMNLAAKLLLDTDKTIFNIAFECGYGDASHFSKAFFRKYGVSPREFRKRR